MYAQMKKYAFLITILPFILQGQQADVTINKTINQIAFGSCSKQDQPEKQLWEEINLLQPDLWIWLGDNIYGDSEDMKVMREKYDRQKSHPEYKKLLKQTDVIGIWDDHDYGVNDGGKEYPAKRESKEELFRFLDVTKNHPARERKGAYQSYTFQGSRRLKIILLDTRYFRDSLKWERPPGGYKSSLTNKTGDILGEDQWEWLTEQLSEEEIDLFIIASGIQIIPHEHQWEKWSNFPVARERLMNSLKKVASPMILLSGDRHWSEVSRIDLEGYPYPLYEFTSSSLTSPLDTREEDTNNYREKRVVFDPNFAHLDLSWTGSWSKKILNLELNYFGKDSKVYQTHLVQFKY